ncbi:MAG TPA: ADOP family duplicated permease [Vicinamibacterales bacterium]|nr:ADOP family duplicated permease [Vicinamibacterales bacterium]
MPRLETIYLDIRLACRLLARRPGFAAVAVLTLAVGLATMTVAFSAVNAFFIARPPIDGAGLIVMAGAAPESEGATFRELEAFVRDVPALEICAQTIVTLSHRRGEATQIAWGLAVSDNYFDVLGVTASVGRIFTGVDELSAVVSHRFWREQLSAASLTGLTVRLNGLDVPVVGVLASDFRAGLYDAEVWVRIRDWDALRLPARNRRPDVPTLNLMARLRPDATSAQADHQLQSVMTELARAWPATNARRKASFVSFEQGLPEMRALAIVAATAMAMIGLVLMIAIFNVVGLLLARAVDRQREMSLRGALGASRARLTQQLVTESLVIAALGGALALLVSRWSNTLLATLAPEAPMPQRLDVTPDWTVAAFTGALMILCGVTAGLVPARRATSLAIAAAMAPPTVIGGSRGGRLRAAVVSMQVAGATLLLTLAALLVRNAVISASVNLGFESERAVVLEIDPASHGYGEPSAQQFASDAIARLGALPGVVSATITDRVPFYIGFPMRLQVSVDGRSCVLDECPTAGSYRVGPDYLRTMNIPLRSGRELDGTQADAQSAVVSDTMARRFWPGGNPLGQWLTFGTDGRRVQVVGVAADVIHRAVTERPEPYVYLPFDQPAFALPVTIVLRTVDDPEPLLRTVSEQMRAMDTSLPIYRLRTMRQRLEAAQQSRTMIIVKFFGICGGLALFLSVVGLAGTVSYSVGQRTREFGIRAAIGAAPAGLVKLVVGGALRMAGPGIAVGLFAALLLTWLIAGSLSGLDLDSPLTFAMVGLLQLTIAVAAAAIPGRRASRADPLVALRAE